MPQAKGPIPDPITGLSYTAHDWKVTCYSTKTCSSSETHPQISGNNSSCLRIKTKSKKVIFTQYSDVGKNEKFPKVINIIIIHKNDWINICIVLKQCSF